MHYAGRSMSQNINIDIHLPTTRMPKKKKKKHIMEENS